MAFMSWLVVLMVTCEMFLSRLSTLSFGYITRMLSNSCLGDSTLTTRSSNIDRLFAMWQAIHPDAFVTPQVDDAGTYTNTPHFSEDVTTC